MFSLHALPEDRTFRRAAKLLCSIFNRPTEFRPIRYRPTVRGRAGLDVTALEPRLVLDGRPLPLPIVYAAAGAGHAPVVKAYTAETGALRFAITAYEPSFQGGVRVGTGDFNGDGIPDVVTAPGPDHAPVIKVFDSKTGDQLSGPLGSFLAYAPSVDGGVYVAAADVDGDRKPDIITSAVTGAGPRIKVFGGATGGLIADFFVPDMASANGLTIAAADVTGDGKAEVVLGSGLGGDGWVRTYDPLSGVVILGPFGNFRAFGTDYGGGVYVGSDALAADVDGDGTLDLAVGTRGPNAQARVRVISGATGAVLHDFLPFGAGVVGGARVGLAYVTDDAHADMVVGTGPGNVGAVRVFDGVTGTQLAAPLGEYAPFGADTVGVFVAASNDPSGQIYGDFFAHVGVSTGTLDLGDMLADENADTGDYTVWIDWDDQTPLSLGSVVCTGNDGMGQNTYDILGEHTYWMPSDEMAPYVVSVEVVDANGPCVTGTVNVTVAPPTVSTAFDTILIPVNADNDNGSAWKAASLPFIPTTRDFDATNLPKDDPELVKLTVTIRGGCAGTLMVSVIDDGIGRAQIWKDKRKSAAFTSQSIPAGTDPAIVVLYVEGTHESDVLNDVIIDSDFITPQLTVRKRDTVTITPVIDSFSNSIPNPSVNFADQGPPVDGLEGLFAGQKNPDIPGIKFSADVNNGPLTIKYMQDFRPNGVQNGTNGSGAGAVYIAGGGANLNYLPNIGSGYTFPGLDTLSNPGDPTDLPFVSTPIPPNGVTVQTWDYPFVNPPNSDKLDKLDVTFLLRTYLVVRYTTDNSIYPIAYWDWSVNFFATTNVANKGVSVIDPASKVTTSASYVVSNDDPYKTAGPIFNSNMDFR